MPLPLLEPVSEGAPTFLGVPRGSLESLTTPFGAMGAPFGVPYTIRNVHHGASEAPGRLGRPRPGSAACSSTTSTSVAPDPTAILGQ